MSGSVAGQAICNVCGRYGIRTRSISHSYGNGDSLLVIENVPFISCLHCSESYLTAETLLEIERIKLHRQVMAEERPVPVAVFVQ